MESAVKDKIIDFIRKNTSKKYALEAWKNKTHPHWGMLEVWQCIYDTAKGNQKEMLNIINQLTKKIKVHGRTQVYADVKTNSVDMVRDENGVLRLEGYYHQSTPELKGQKIERNPNIFKKSDGQVKKRYQETEATLMNVGTILRRVFPDASNVFLAQALKSIKLYAEKQKKSPMLIVNRIALHRLVFDDDFNLVPPSEKGVSECVTRKTIMITEEMASFLKEKAEMTEYKFYSNVKHFINDLLVDPINATTPFLLKINGLTRGKLLHYLIKNGAVQKTQHINDKDENGNPKAATMMVKYKRAPEKVLDRKLNRLWIKLFERNVPEYKNVISEDGEGGDCGGGCEIMGATSAESSGQYSQPLFSIQRRTVKEDATTSSVGDYQYNVPFAGDAETLSRNNGVGGSTSINHINENLLTESDYYDYLEDYSTYEILNMFDDNINPWLPLINPDMYKKACEEFVKFGSFQRFPTRYIYQWMGIIMKNTAILRELTALNGHDAYFPMDEFLDYYFGDQYEEENEQKWEEWCEQCGESNFYAAYAYLKSLGFDKWAKLPDGSDAISDYGIQPIEKLIAEYDENMSPEKCLVLVNKILDVVHCRGDLASAFITGGSKSCQDITYRQNESVAKSINLINEYLDKNMRKVRQGIEKARDEFGKWAEKPYGEDKREVIHNEWMIHFSNDESLRSIAKQGFTQGNRYDKEPEQVTYGKHKYEGGFNYAYLASDVIESFGATTEVELNDLRSSFMYVLSQEKLNGFMMFKGNGYRFFHTGDAENQVVFNSIQPDTKVMIIYLDGFYCVMRNTDIKYDYRTEKPFKKSENGGRVKTIEDNPRNQMNNIIYFSRNIEKVIEWVKTNFEQYRRRFKY